MSPVRLEANGARWPSRSSKSVAPCFCGEAGFDSQALPPRSTSRFLSSAFGTDVPRARTFRGWLFVETDALPFIELLEAACFHCAAVEEPLLPTVVTNEPEAAIPHQSLNRTGRHRRLPFRRDRAEARSTCGWNQVSFHVVRFQTVSSGGGMDAWHRLTTDCVERSAVRGAAAV